MSIHLDKEVLHIASGIQNPLFASRDTFGEAYQYAYEVAKASRNPSAVLTAVHVILNTLALQLEDKVRAAHHAEFEAFEAWANQESREG